MSRVGQSVINIPEGVEVKQNDNIFWVKGSRGELNTPLSDAVNISVVDKVITVEPKDKSSKGKALWL